MKQHMQQMFIRSAADETTSVWFNGRTDGKDGSHRRAPSTVIACPPQCGSRSNSVTTYPRASSSAAVNPAHPAPTTAIRCMEDARCTP
jgi:hypothetical protein